MINYSSDFPNNTHHTIDEIYNSETLSLPTTVYGGSVDVTGGSGEITKDSLTVDGSSYLSYYTEGTNTVRCYLTDAFYIKPNNTTEIRIICDKLQCYAPDYIYSNDVMGISENKNPSGNGLWIRVEKSLLSAVSFDGLKAWLTSNPIQVVYEKTTSDSLSTTPTSISLLNGVNNVWSECSEDGAVIGNAQQSLSYQPQNIVGQLRQEINGKIDKGWHDSFSNLTDTAFSNLANGQIPKWNSTTRKWENANESGGVLPAWTVLAGLGYNDDVELPATFSELLVVVANGDGYNDLLSSSIFIADVADFDVSAERFPVLQIPIYLQGSTMWSILEGSVSNNKRIYTLKGYQNSIAVIYYR